jgi:hypothetical protein
MSELVIYESGEGASGVSVCLDGDTVWLTQRQMGELFDSTPENVLMHLKNIFTDGELDEPATAKDFLVVQTEGKREVQRNLKHYNLDAIISVGYRVNSKRGTRFRQWATRVLREHLTHGYTLHQTRLAEIGLTEAQQAIALLARTLENQALVNDAGREVVALIADYAKTWRLLLQYDEDGLSFPATCQPARGVLDYARAAAAIADLKAAHLLYFVIKDHPFSDGNKRIGSFLFLLYLQQENMAMSINENALTALALLVAESQPTNKDLMIRLVVNLLVSSEPNS